MSEAKTGGETTVQCTRCDRRNPPNEDCPECFGTFISEKPGVGAVETAGLNAVVEKVKRTALSAGNAGNWREAETLEAIAKELRTALSGGEGAKP